MNYKTLTGLLILFFYSISVHTQDYELLWEVAGQDFQGKSYVFGSMHHNAEVIFEMHDSLAYAIQSCEAIANEVNFDSLASYFSNDLMGAIFSNSDENGESSDSDAGFGFVDKDGRETLLDLYLLRAGRHLGLSIHGLEPFTEEMFQDEILKALSKDDEDYDYQSEEFREFLRVYASGDLSAIEELLNGYEFDEEFTQELIERNDIQAESIIRLGKQQPTFSIVGAAHLFGENNVLDILRHQGYQVRKVGKGSPTELIEEWYKGPIEQKIYEVKGKLPGYSIKSIINEEGISLNEAVDMHTNIDLEGGFFMITMVFPSNMPNVEDMEKTIVQGFLNDEQDQVITPIESKTHDRLSMYELEDNVIVTALTKSDRLSAFYLGICFSKRVTSSDRFIKALENISFFEEKIEWLPQSDLANFQYLFPPSIEWIVNKTTLPGYEERGEIEIHYKTHVDTETKDEYLIRYNSNPPGITHMDEYNGLTNTLTLLLTNFKAELKEKEFIITTNNYNGINATAVDVNGVTYYFKLVIRGSAMHLILQKSPSGVRNDGFFNSLKLLPIAPKDEWKDFDHEDSHLSIRVPEWQYYYETNNDDSFQENYSFAYEGLAATMDVELEKVNRYTTVDPLDSLFVTFESNIKANVDSLLELKYWDHNSDCTLYGAHYMSDSSTMITTELITYDNDYIYSFVLISPYEALESGHIDNIVESIRIEPNPLLVYSIFESKLPLILEDLRSDDTTVFNAARVALSDYEILGDSDKNVLINGLGFNMKDDNESYNSKNDIITLLHEFEDEETEIAIMEYFKKSQNLENRERIIESLSMRSGDLSFERLLELLKAVDEGFYLDEDIYLSAQDSLALFGHYYDEMKSLAEDKVAYLPFMNLNIFYLDSINALPFMDTIWLANEVEGSMVSYIEQWKKDSAVYIQEHTMEYLLNHPRDTELMNEFYNAIKISDDNYAKYRMIFNQSLNGQKVDHEQVAQSAESDYYRYWLLSLYRDVQDIPPVLRDAEANAISVHKNYISNNYGVYGTDCKTLDSYPSKVSDHSMTLVSCREEETENHYVGLIGPMDKSGFINLDTDDSVYYSEGISKDQFESVTQRMVEYYNTEE